jgi:hypothetical protein
MPAPASAYGEHTRPGEGTTPMPELQISPEKVAWLILKLQAFSAKVSPYETDAENDDPGEDQIADALENRGDDPVVREVVGFVRSLNDDEETDLVALAWLGRGTYEIEDWDDARSTAAEERTTRTEQYLLGTPLAAEYLAEGLSAFGFDPATLEANVSAEG